MNVDAKLKEYRKRYKSQGSLTSCGDWLSRRIDEVCRVTRIDSKSRKRMSIDFDKFDALLLENGVLAIGKWTESRKAKRPGWQGRYRMHGRQKLEAAVIRNGYLALPDYMREHPPEDWLERVNRRVR